MRTNNSELATLDAAIREVEYLAEKLSEARRHLEIALVALQHPAVLREVKLYWLRADRAKAPDTIE